MGGTLPKPHLDSLVDKLREERVQRVLTAVINGDEREYDRYHDALNYCQDIGLVSRTPPIRFANPGLSSASIQLLTGHINT